MLSNSPLRGRADGPIAASLDTPSRVSTSVLWTLLPCLARRDPSTGRFPIKTFHVKRQVPELGRSQGTVLHLGRVRGAGSRGDFRAVCVALATRVGGELQRLRV